MDTRKKWLIDLFASFKELVYTITHDEKLPLALAVVAQGYTIGYWQYRTGPSTNEFLNAAVAIIAMFALDLVITSTAFSEKRSRASWILSIATSVVAWIFGCAIAVYLYNGLGNNVTSIWLLDPWSFLHIAWPTIVLLYSWYISVVKHEAIAEEKNKAQEPLEEYWEKLIRRMLKKQKLADILSDIDIMNIIGGNRTKVAEIIKRVKEDLTP